MSERYSRLYALPENIYKLNGPVLINAGALLYDNESSCIIAQVKYTNLEKKHIKAIKAKIETFDTAERPVGQIVTCEYLDLDVAEGHSFGNNKAILINAASARMFLAYVTEVVFSDNTIWQGDDKDLYVLSQKTPLGECFDDSELFKQYCIDCGYNSKFCPVKEHDLWLCACGTYNKNTRTTCNRCGKEMELHFSRFDFDTLTAEKDNRLKEEAEKEKKKKKQAKTIFLIISAVIVLAIAGVVIFNIIKQNILQNKYNQAQEYIQNNDIASAKEILMQLEGFPDAQEILLNCNIYELGQEYFNAGNYENAARNFESLGDFADSSQYVSESIYQKALNDCQNNRFVQSLKEFEKIEDYKDTKEQIELAKQAAYDFCIKEAAKLTEDSSIDEIKEICDSIDNYNDCYFELGVQSYEKGLWRNSGQFFSSVPAQSSKYNEARSFIEVMNCFNFYSELRSQKNYEDIKARIERGRKAAEELGVSVPLSIQSCIDDIEKYGKYVGMFVNSEKGREEYDKLVKDYGRSFADIYVVDVNYYPLEHELVIYNEHTGYGDRLKGELEGRSYRIKDTNTVEYTGYRGNKEVYIRY